MTPLPCVAAGDGGGDIGAARFHVVIGGDADRFHALLRADDVHRRAQEFVGQVAVRHKYQTDHAGFASPDVGAAVNMAASLPVLATSRWTSNGA